MRSALLLTLALAIKVYGREITFPPVAGIDVQHPMGPVDNDADLSAFDFWGLTTYANLPYVHCLAKDEKEIEKYDIAIIGAPFDTGVTARPGARFGPNGIRQGSRRIMPGAVSIYTGKNYLMKAKVVDCGDAPLTFLDNTVALKQLDTAHKVISSRSTNSSDYSVPRIVTLGGDHTTTLSALRSTYNHWGAVSVIHFDSHLDTWDPDVLGGGLSHYA